MTNEKRERQAIQPDDKFGEPSFVKRGNSTEIALWRSEYKGVPQVSVAQRHPQRTSGYWSTRQPIVYDGELTREFFKQSLGHTIDDNGDPITAVEVKAKPAARRGRK